MKKSVVFTILSLGIFGFSLFFNYITFTYIFYALNISESKIIQSIPIVILSILPIYFLYRIDSVFGLWKRYFGICTIISLMNAIVLFSSFTFINSDISSTIKETAQMNTAGSTGDIMAWATAMILLSVVIIFHFFIYLGFYIYSKKRKFNNG